MAEWWSGIEMVEWSWGQNDRLLLLPLWVARTIVSVLELLQAFSSIQQKEALHKDIAGILGTQTIIKKFNANRNINTITGEPIWQAPGFFLF